MFTGIVEGIGIVAGIKKTRPGRQLAVKTQGISSGTKLGDSIAVDGVCLSVTDIRKNILTFDVIYETLDRTTLGELKINDPVNLERSLKADSRIGGHFVTGHIDYKGRIEKISKDSNGAKLDISLPDRFSNLVSEKGSIAIDGVSLTAGGVGRDSFIVYLIPHTLKVTTLGKKKKGDPVNVETDLLAKYLIRHTQKPNLQDLLKRYNYI